MFRVKLFIVIATLLAIILILAATLFFGMQRTDYLFQRSHLAQTAAQSYIDLSHNAYRHIKELTDILALDISTPDTEYAAASKRWLVDSVDAVKHSINAEVNHIQTTDNAKEIEHEQAELEQLARIEETLEKATWLLERVQVLRGVGAKRSASEMLTTALEETIDQRFRSQIDSAIAQEMAEAAEAKRRAVALMERMKIVAMAVATFATLFALAMGWLLWHNLNTPLRRLLTGVREVAKGDMEHRITLPGRNEFTYLAKNFNQMTEQLARQRADLLNAQAGLEAQVKSRTRDLQQANDKLKLLDEARRRFFADISHELRTPLTAIRGEAEVTLRGREKETSEYRTSLRRIIDLAAQLASLVEDLLFLARSETASIRFDIQPVALGELVRVICDEAGALAQAKRLTLQAVLPAAGIRIHGDSQRLRQLLLILIDNSCRYTPAGGGAITVSLDADRDYATLTVADQGIGIARDELAHVFERHFRGEEARRIVPSGTGLGLSLAKTIVEAHEGHISITSSPNQGTTVEVRLPRLITTEE